MNAFLVALALNLGLGSMPTGLETTMATDINTITDQLEADAGGRYAAFESPRQRLFGLLGGRRGPSLTARTDTISAPVNARIVRDVQWEVGRNWALDPDRIHLRWGSVSGEIPDRVVSVRILGTGAKGHWIALLAPADPMATPARLRVRAGVERLIPVAARDLPRGTVLKVDDIAHDPTVVWGRPKGDSIGVRPGWVVNRLLSEGDELRHPAVSEPNAVTSGEEIEIIWHRGPVAVSVGGVALGSVPLGDPVRVRTDSGRRLEGVAHGPGVVMVGGRDESEW